MYQHHRVVKPCQVRKYSRTYGRFKKDLGERATYVPVSSGQNPYEVANNVLKIIYRLAIVNEAVCPFLPCFFTFLFCASCTWANKSDMPSQSLSCK